MASAGVGGYSFHLRGLPWCEPAISLYVMEVIEPPSTR
jgi:hypothetical protein